MDDESSDAVPSQRSPVQNLLQYRNHMVLKKVKSFPPVFAFTTLTGQMIASCEMDTKFFGLVMDLEPGPEKLFLDPDGHLVLGIREEERRALSTRRSCIVRSCNTEIIGRVVIKSSGRTQNNSIQDTDYRPIARFERLTPLFHSMTTSFQLPDGEEVGRMKHKEKGKRVLIEFSTTCSEEMKILIMAAAILYQRRDLTLKDPFPEGRATGAKGGKTWLQQMRQ